MDENVIKIMDLSKEINSDIRESSEYLVFLKARDIVLADSDLTEKYDELVEAGEQISSGSRNVNTLTEIPVEIQNLVEAQKALTKYINTILDEIKKSI